VHGGWLLAFGLPVWACHVLAFTLIQLAFQRGRALATAGLSSFCTNALPIAAGVAIYHESTPPGFLGAMRFVALGASSSEPRWSRAVNPVPGCRTSCRSPHRHQIDNSAPITWPAI